MPVTYLVPVTGTEYLDLTGIAAAAGITPDSARTYHTRAVANRRSGSPKPGDLPEPDITIAGRPAWRADTIQTWMANRPGQGAGGGRPRTGP